MTRELSGSATDARSLLRFSRMKYHLVYLSGLLFRKIFNQFPTLGYIKLIILGRWEIISQFKFSYPVVPYAKQGD
jgi:hypothetical protein